MKLSVFIATSVDGFIARLDGDVDWLNAYGNQQAEMGLNTDMGFENYIRSVDCMIMGRGCMENFSSMNLKADQWLYGDIKIIALSNSIKVPPKNLRDKVEIYNADLQKLGKNLENKGYKHGYIDGGKTIQSFLNLQLINEIAITQVPVILGQGIPLFGIVNEDIRLEKSSATVFPNNYVQLSYDVCYQ